jgi:uncharacterized protein (DUF1015 family)
VSKAIAPVTGAPPMVSFTASDGVEHTVWRVAGTESLVSAYTGIATAYVADGHHRAASAARVAAERRQANPGHTGQEAYNWFLAVLFPARQLKVLPYHRCVRDLNGMEPGVFLDVLSERFRVSTSASASPGSGCNISVYLGGTWYGLSWDRGEGVDPVSELDVSVLQDRLLGPVLGITDPRTDPRIDFVGGIRGTGELVERVDTGRAAAAFSMYPTTVEQLMAVADSGAMMPPKSTWFEPKLRSGLLVHRLD